MENKQAIIWTDEVRLKMIERSEFYDGSEKIYQYGYYDGFQEGLVSHQSHLREIREKIFNKMHLI
jgi:hypothetical protein